MKEATGELNMTIIIVFAVTMLIAFFSTFIWPIIKSSTKHDASCSDAICAPCPTNNCPYVECHRKGEEGNPFQCPYKG